MSRNRPSGSRERAGRPSGRNRKDVLLEEERETGGIGAAALDNPVAAGGSLVMALTASLIVANATFFQATPHPAPLFETRHDPGDTAQEPTRQPDPAMARRRKLVLDVQVELRRLGMYEGSLDGLSGPATERAVRAWERARGLPESGTVDEKLLGRLAMDRGGALHGVPVPPPSPVPPDTGTVSVRSPGEATAPLAPPPSPAATSPSPGTAGGGDIGSLIARETGVPVPPADVGAGSPDRERVRAIQSGLMDLGYGPIDVDGLMGEQTANAVRRFELDRGLAITGEISDTLLQEIRRALRR